MKRLWVGQTLLALSLFLSQGQAQPNFAVVSAASFAEGLAPEMLASGFTDAIPEIYEVATEVPLPMDLVGYSVVITDSTGVDRPAGLVGIFTGQVNFVVPETTALGPATISMRKEGGTIAAGEAEISAVAPGVITATSSGAGAPAGFLQTYPAEGDPSNELLFDSSPERLPIPFDISDDTRQYYLLLFGTGVRGRSDLSAVEARLGGVEVPVTFAGEQGEYEALDQFNLGPLPQILSGRGALDLEIVVDGVAANVTQIAFGGPLLAPAPEITGITPNSVTAGETTVVTIAGAYLDQASGVAVEPSDGIEASIVGTASLQDNDGVQQSTLQVSLVVALNAATGERTLRLTSSNGDSNGFAFDVEAPPTGRPGPPMISNLVIDQPGEGIQISFDYSDSDGDIDFEHATFSTNVLRVACEGRVVGIGVVGVEEFLTGRADGETLERTGVTRGTITYTKEVAGLTMTPPPDVKVKVSVFDGAGNESNELQMTFSKEFSCP
jgi:uncharacterized protein (TIGR03437 family)